MLGLIFLRYADHRFTTAEAELGEKSSSRRTVGKTDYQAKGVLYLPNEARLPSLLALPNIGQAVDEAGKGHNGRLGRRVRLIQHSAGSGKSNTISWTAHQVTNLHDDADKPIFSSAVIVTDRIVLDRQLQNTVAQFEQTKGVVKKIDGTSRQLKEALEGGARIVITTIQKFSTEHLAALSGQGSRTFAVIIDEAHGSQSGKSAQAMSDALTRDEGMTSDDIEDLIADYQNARGPQPNISYFAFTATPRNVTLERFGAKGADGLPQPFHLYSMRQAIEEGFILDVLQNCMTYKAYYQLEKTIEDDPEPKGRSAQRRVARFASLHRTAIGQKVEVVIEHFRRHVMGELGGQARAMIVTGGREHALRYFFGVRDYINAHRYTDLKALVAFSGELELDGETYTEAALNGFSETELPRRFDTGDYRVLIVAEKYQTGFHQPKLCAMYMDRKLAGLQAVQTLSRLNRTYPGKERTYVLDFQNTIEEIQAAFKPYYEVTALEANSDPNQIYELEARLKTFGILDQGEIDRFAETFYKGPLDTHDRARLEGLVRHAVARFEAEDDEGRREEFRQLLKSYMRFYSFVAQIIRLDDTGLETLYTYAAWLSRLLPNREIPADIEITEDMLRLQAFRVEQKEEGAASLGPGDTETLTPISEFAAKPYTEEEERSLSEIIKAFNDRHGTAFTRDDFIRFEQVNREIMDDDLTEMLRRPSPPSGCWRDIGEHAIKLPDSKTGPHAVPLGEAARAHIEALANPRDPEAHLFPRHAEGRGLSILTTCWRAVCADAKLGRLRLHDLRHTAASHAVMSGENLPLVGKLLGHRRHQTTAGYAHLADSHLVAAAEKIGNAIVAAMTRCRTP